MSEEPWQTVAVLSTMPPTVSAISCPTDWASHEVEDQPYIRGFFAFASIWAVYSTASSYETSLYEPSSCCIRGRVMRSFAWEWRNFSAPIAQAL